MARRIPLTLLTLLVAAALLFFPRAASVQAAPSDALPPMLLTLDGLKGGFTGGAFKDAIEVSSYSLGASVQAAAGSGHGAGKPAFTDVSLTKRTDASSLALLKALATGKPIKDGYLYFQTRSASQPRTYMVIHFSDLLITGYQNDSSGDAPSTETFALQAESMLYKYMTVNPDGSPGSTITVPIGKDPGTSSVATKYHFDPIYAATASGTTYIKGFTVTLKSAAVNSTVQQTLYRINGGAWTIYTGPFAIYADDAHTVEYYSSDMDEDIEPINVMNFDAGTFTGSGSY
ncbi:type VI secretion system tube protein Hcp [Paenibacillus lycopersici]|uniref:Type VI secretion system tube protein Hcp n=1 Tax=Paenibacillus lycopersici TaxID=2704462 RepID=A0A6C0G6Y7_9BACL|nr:type VI secretion system tube protein Hcp [Paenibacillus lycopersici]QHT62275.1 type VI secretion system tube protein Hcp [Paenibacillus lycopersici]